MKNVIVLLGYVLIQKKNRKQIFCVRVYIVIIQKRTKLYWVTNRSLVISPEKYIYIFWYICEQYANSSVYQREGLGRVKHEMLIHYCYNFGPAATTLVPHNTNIRSASPGNLKYEILPCSWVCLLASIYPCLVIEQSTNIPKTSILNQTVWLVLIQRAAMQAVVMNICIMATAWN